MRQRRAPFIVAFLLPAVILFAVFVISPYAQAFQISLTNWQGVSPTFDYVGLDNYAWLWTNAVWTKSVLHNVALFIALPILVLGLALLFAALVTYGGSAGRTEGVAGSRFYRLLFFFPYIIPMVVVGVLWRFLYDPNLGILDSFLRFVQLDPRSLAPNGWLATESTVLGAIAVVAVWAWVGFYMVLFVAGMQQIPRELYESAALDGAGRIRMFFGVTLPLLWDHVQVAFVYLEIQALDMFVFVQVMTDGGPDHASEVMATDMYRTAFSYAQWGRASAMGVSMLVISLVFALVTFRMTRRERVEY